MIWGLLATLQLIVHMPLLHVATPSNFFIFSKLVIGTANFQIIPTDEIVESILEIKETSTKA